MVNLRHVPCEDNSALMGCPFRTQLSTRATSGIIVSSRSSPAFEVARNRFELDGFRSWGAVFNHRGSMCGTHYRSHLPNSRANWFPPSSPYLNLMSPIILCALLSIAFGSHLNVSHLNGTFKLLSGPQECPPIIRTSRARNTNISGTVEIDVDGIIMGSNTCIGDGYVVMSLLKVTDSLKTTVRRRGGSSGRSRGSSFGRSRGSSFGRSRGGRPSALRRPGSLWPTIGRKSIKRPPSQRAVSIVRGSRIKNSGLKGRNWLGAAWLLSGLDDKNGSNWRSKRKSVTGEDEDIVSRLSEKLERRKVPHYYGYYTNPKLKNATDPDYTKWNFTCGRYGVEFRTRFIFFELSILERFAPYSHEVPYLFTIGTMYKNEKVGTFETTSHPTFPCIYHNSNYSRMSRECLPGDGTILMKDGSTKRVDELVEGHQVAIGDDIFMFTHKDAELIAPFLRIMVDGGDELELTQGHYLYINGNLGQADSVRIGDLLSRADRSKVRVAQVDMVMKRGVYNPQTIRGDIVMNGFVVSTYTKTIEPKVAHSALTPLRMVWRSFGWSFRRFYLGIPESWSSIIT